MKEANSKGVGKQYEVLKLPYLVLVVSLLITLGATYFYYQTSQSKDLIRFQGEVNRTRTIIENKINTYITILKAGRGFIESNKSVDKKSFATFVKNLNLETSYPGLQGVGFAEKITSADSDNFLLKMKAEGNENFKIFPENSESKNKDLFVIVYLEPFNEQNQRAIGFNFASEPNRLQAMEMAQNSGLETLSGKPSITQSNLDYAQAGFLIFLPVYRGGETPQTIEDRQQLLDGYIYSPLKTTDFLNEIKNNLSSEDLAITIYDNELSNNNILAQKDIDKVDKNNPFYAKNEINAANRTLIIEYKTCPSFEIQSTVGITPLIFISGLTFSLILFGMTYLESFARANSEKIANDLRESEKQKEFLLASEQKARETAENASKAKDAFIANVSHELRTPLNSIAGWSKILQAENISPVTKNQALRTIDRNLRIQTKIIEELLDFSQIVSGKAEAGKQKIHFSSLFEEVFSEISLIAGEKGVSLKKENNLNGQQIIGDYSRLKKVVKNLMLNAIKFTPAGGAVNTRANEKDGIIEFMVQDNGKGIDADFLPHIFESFKQADDSITRQYGGLGLGLATTRQIVELYGGNIKVESEGIGKGTTFTVQLPLADKK